jgi:hypothetical protein
MAVGGVPVAELFDEKGNPLSADVTQPRLAYTKDGQLVGDVSQLGMAVGGVPVAELVDENGEPMGAGVAVAKTTESAIVAAAVVEELQQPDIAQSAEKPTEKEPASPSEERKRPTSDSLSEADFADSEPKLSSGDFHWADLDKNGYISAEEVLHCIDRLFDGDAEFTVEDIQNLIDFYFDQD